MSEDDAVFEARRIRYIQEVNDHYDLIDHEQCEDEHQGDDDR